MRPEALILGYHAVSVTWPTSLAIHPNDLRDQIAMLKSQGYEFSTLTRVATDTQSRRLATITFDDAFGSVFSLARPILAEFGVPATVFAPTGYIGRERQLAWPGLEKWRSTPFSSELGAMDWPQLRELVECGWEVGSHTVTHPVLTNLSWNELCAELSVSKSDIETNLGAECLSFCAPWGMCDLTVIRAARQLGYVAGCNSRRLPRRAFGPLNCPRVEVRRDDHRRLFAVRTSLLARRLRRSRAMPILGLLTGRGGHEPWE